MKNLEKFGVQTLDAQEMRETDGGKNAGEGECVNGLFEQNGDFSSSSSEKKEEKESSTTEDTYLFLLWLQGFQG